MKVRICLLFVLLMAMAVSMAFADSAEWDGTWLYEVEYAWYGIPSSAHQRMYAHSSYEMEIDGSKAVIRAHMPYEIPFALELNEETGWFERTGTIRNGVLTVDGLEDVTYTISEVTTDFLDKNLVISGGVLDEMGDSLTFEPDEEGLVFDAQQTFGSWGIAETKFELPRYSSYFELGHRVRKLGQLGYQYDQLYVSDERVTLIESSHVEGALMSKEGRCAIDATDIQVKDGGIFVAFEDVRVKLYADPLGILRVIPLFTANEIAIIEQAGGSINGGERYEFEPMFMDVYGDAPIMQPGTYQLESKWMAWEGWEKQKKKIVKLIESVGGITFGENNAVSIEFNGELREGTLVYPDAYTCEDKESFAFFSFEEEGFTISISMEQDGESLVLLVSKGKNKLATFRFSDKMLRIAGEYRGDGYPGESVIAEYQIEDEFGNLQWVTEERVPWIDEEIWLTVDEDLTVTMNIAGETHVGRLNVFDIMDERSSWLLGEVTLDGMTYNVMLNGEGELQRIELSSDDRWMEFRIVSREFEAFMLEPATRRFEFGSGIATYGGLIKKDEIDRLFNTFDSGVFYIGRNWDRVVFSQGALASVYEYMTVDMLFMQDAMECEIPVIGSEITGSGTPDARRILHLDMHGNAVDFVLKSDGGAEVVVGIYHLDFQPLN